MNLSSAMNLSSLKAIETIDVSTREEARHNFLEHYNLLISFTGDEMKRCHSELRDYLGHDQGGRNSIRAEKIEVLNNSMLRVTFASYHGASDIAYLVVEERAPQFNHTFDFCFEVVSECDEATDVTPETLRERLLERLNRLEDSELAEACGLCDTNEIS